MILVREAAAQDFPVIYSLIRNELGYSDFVEKDTIGRLERIGNNKDWATFVAVVNNEVVGFVGLMKGITYEIEGYYSQIMALAVSEKTRREGVGTALVKKAEEWSLTFGINNILVRSNVKRLNAHTFYKNSGFMQIKESFTFAKDMQTKDL